MTELARGAVTTQVFGPVEGIETISDTLGVVLTVAARARTVFVLDLRFLIKQYGLAGVVLWIFGSGAIWRMQKQVLESEGDKVAMDFKASAQNESNMIAVAVRALGGNVANVQLISLV